jgi:pantoate--beta-alanine ligase
MVRSIDDFRTWRADRHGSVGLVPTMGYLHEGHLSLVRAARRDNDSVVVSIFVNPAQFAPNEDFDRYPRDEARDIDLLDEFGVDCVFAPSVESMYHSDFSAFVVVEGLSSRLEGKSRPSHFRGVTTVVMKLLNIVQPQRAYFGQKDAQQLAIIRRMVRDLDVPVEIVGKPIVRDADGLALSSRNVYLTPEQRQAALVLNRSLRAAEAMFARGVGSAIAIRDAVTSSIAAEPLAEIDYVSVADHQTLVELEHIEGVALVSVAVRFGATRLIDNTILSH